MAFYHAFVSQEKKDEVKATFLKELTDSNWFAFRYETEDGATCRAIPVSQAAKFLRERGWKNTSGIDASDLKACGLKVVKAQYVGGARKTGRFIDVVVA